MPASFSIDKMSTSTIEMYRVLADGEIHPRETLRDVAAAVIAREERDFALRCGQRVKATPISRGGVYSEDDLVAAGASDAARNRLMIMERSGRLVSRAQGVRLSAAALREWRSAVGDAPAPAAEASAGATEVVAAEPAAQQDPAGGTGVARRHDTSDDMSDDESGFETDSDDEGEEAVEGEGLEDGEVQIRVVRGRTFRNGPMIFGGIEENDGFALAPLETHARVHFRTHISFDHEVFAADLPAGATHSEEHGRGLHRVDALLAHIKDWLGDRSIATDGIKAEGDVQRRRHRDLDEQFLADLCRHYQMIVMRKIRKQQSVVARSIPEHEDQISQAQEWILDAVAIFDHTKGVPFGAFLTQRVARWIHDLTRRGYGRTISDAELRIARARTAYIAEHQSTPTPSQLAEFMGEDPGAFHATRQAVSRVANLRAVMSLEAIAEEHGEIVAHADHNVEAEACDPVDAMALSASLTFACEDGAARKSAFPQPNVLGLLATYETMYRGRSKVEVADAMGTSMRNLNVYAKRAQAACAERLTAGAERR